MERRRRKRTEKRGKGEIRGVSVMVMEWTMEYTYKICKCVCGTRSDYNNTDHRMMRVCVDWDGIDDLFHFN